MASDKGCTIECQDCEWSGEFDTKIEHGPSEYEDETIILDEPEECPECGSSELSVYVHGSKIQDEGREDFHSDG